jgi:hypothetical protein
MPSKKLPGQPIAAGSVVSAAALLSFLKQTGKLVPWTEADLSKALTLSPKAAKEAVAVMQMQGYVSPAKGKHAWMTSPDGELVSGWKNPRFSRESVKAALSDLASRIRETNQDASAEYKIINAVAFGDFLSGQPKVQHAEVGIGLILRDETGKKLESAKQRAAELAFLAGLRKKSALLRIQTYAPWMSDRSHRDLLDVATNGFAESGKLLDRVSSLVG